MRQSRGVFIKAFSYFILTSAAVCLVFPFVWMFSGAFKDALEVVRMPPGLLPERFGLDNFLDIREYFPVERFMLNSIIVAFGSTILQLAFCSMAAFVFAKVAFKGRDALFILFLMTMMIPIQVRVTPIYVTFVNIGIDNTYTALILPGVFSAFGTFLLRQHILTIPDSFMESAFIDGASYFKVYYSIILPLSKPALAITTVFAFMYSWNDYLWPLIITSSTEMATMPLGLAKLSNKWSTEWNILMTGNVISFLPIMLVYLFAQSYFIRGLTAGGVKG